jgi:hypothetical protein
MAEDPAEVERVCTIDLVLFYACTNKGEASAVVKRGKSHRLD